uniref:Replication-associated protein n=1 Tax=Red panda feces-associated genomovirus TaxID=2863991 RepID=A0A8K1M3Y8_9VIRU|nr:replication-associated protein [Red panda feces-associated genomovirus]
MSKKPFRLSAKRVFLTYPRLPDDVTHSDLHQYLTKWGDVYSCLEAHKDGGQHVHAIITNSTKFNIRREDYFDYCGRHPNIQPVADVRACSAYVSKGGDTQGIDPSTDGASRTTRLTTLLNESRDYDEFIRGYEQIDPHGFINNFDRIRSFGCQRYQRRGHVELRSRIEFNHVPPIIDEWVAANLFPQPERPKCLVLIGPTRLGKTEWARSLGTHNYYPNTITMDRDASARYCVIDDMDYWDKFPYKKQFFGCHKEIGMCLKYQKPEIVTWGIPTIWLWNNENVPHDVLVDGYFQDNSVVVYIRVRVRV